MAEDATVLTQMTADLDSMFQTMVSSERRGELDRHSALIRFGRDFAEAQSRLIDHQTNQKSDPPPMIDPSWTPPQSVKQANQQFQRFPEFGRARDEAIDVLSHELLEVNNQMITTLDEIYGHSARAGS
jgi:hypothetical protein